MDVTDIKGYSTGMPEWRIRQELYHRLNTEHDDDLNTKDIVYRTDNLIGDILLHFNGQVDEWIYPAKSYFVAFCYAHWISIDFNEHFFDLLDHPMLLAGNDPYFKRYSESPEIYDEILDIVEWPLEMKGMVPDVRKYYEVEIGSEFHVSNTN